MICKKKILHVIAYCNGGASKVAEDIMLGTCNEFDEEFLLFQGTERCRIELLKKRNIEVYTLNYKNRLNPFIVFRLRRYMKDVDIVHAHQFPALYWVAIASLLIFKPPKLVFTEHAAHNNRRGRWYLRWIEKLIYRRYNKIVGVSKSVTENIRKWIGDTNKLVTIYNGIDISGNRKLVFPINLKKQFPYPYLICMVGRISVDKDIDTLINAMSLLPCEYHLLLVGDGELLEEKQLKVKLLGIENKVSFLGYRKDILSILNECDLSILSSFSEGFGLVILESLSVGTPCIGSCVNGIIDIFTEDNRIFLFKQGDAKELADKIKMMIHAKNDEKIISQIRDICVRYDINNMILKYLAVYKGLLNK